MSDSSENIAARAEARRKKILENAQKRLDRVLCIPELKEDMTHPLLTDSSQENVKTRADHNTELFSETADGLCNAISIADNSKLLGNRKSRPNTSDMSSLKMEDAQCSKMRQATNGRLLPQKESEKNNTVQDESHSESTKLADESNVSTNDNLSRKNNLTQTKLDPNVDEFDFSKHLKFLEKKSQITPQELEKNNSNLSLTHMHYVVLAIVIRLMLYIQYGWLFGDNILVPFMLTESVHISLDNVHDSQLVQVLSQVMTLCGFPSHIVQCYARINTILLHCVEDFSVYFVTFCVLHSYLDDSISLR